MNKKIDIYLRKFGTNIWQYECSTNFYKTCKEAKQSFCKRHGLDETLSRFVEAKIGFDLLWDTYKDSAKDSATLVAFFSMLTAEEQLEVIKKSLFK